MLKVKEVDFGSIHLFNFLFKKQSYLTQISVESKFVVCIMTLVIFRNSRKSAVRNWVKCEDATYFFSFSWF